jgi:hypothetical protein
MYSNGNLDFFNNNKNSTIYATALSWYSTNNYHLIENGDIEDFWMRSNAPQELILTISDQLPWPFYSNMFESASFRGVNQVHAFNILLNNLNIYTLIRNLFHEKGKYTRLIGNHDDVWADENMTPIMQIIYPNISINDYCTLEDPATGNTEIIMAHGHQTDIFNTPMCNFAGKALTNLASQLHILSFGELNLFTKSKNDWETEWKGKGFSDELTKMNLLELESFSEYDLYKMLEEIYGNSTRQPYLILGHTHQPKDNAGIPGWMYQDQWNWNEYSNSGTVGMWEEVIFGLEVEYPDIRVIAWRMENGTIIRHTLNEYRYGTTYLKPV